MAINKYQPYKYFVFLFFIFLSVFSYLLSFFNVIVVSIYAFLIITYFFTQISFAFLNRRFYNQEAKRKELNYHNINTCPKVTLLIVGYRENIDYWRNCLNSVIKQNYINIIQIIISIDGNEEDDMYMKSIAEDIFNLESHSYELTILLNDHGGKREAICNGLHRVSNDSDYVMFIDSDTVLTESATYYLVQCVDSNKENGCATGCLLIFDNHFLGKVINARYGYAFNLERAAMSYCGVMNCCSGPLSIYRRSLLDENFIKEFQNQTFCEIKCGPGDDRHLTNMIMIRGYKSRQTHLSLGYTEAPESYIRFIKQQTRWIRSFFREQVWQIKAIPYQSIYLALITHYEIVYPILVFIWLLYVNLSDLSKNFVRLLVFTVTIILIRTMLLVSIMRKREFLYNIFYLPIFIFTILPLKLYCLITMNKMNWTTSSRIKLINKIDIELVIITMLILLWDASVIYSLISKNIKLYYDCQNGIECLKIIDL
jgi:hyaluronan synthase